jgi:2'-5' RNA ligase
MAALTDSLFFAIYPDAAAAARIAQLALRLNVEHGLRGKPAATDRFHVTLHHLGAFAGLPDDIVARAKEAASNVSMPPVDVAFDGTRSRSSFEQAPMPMPARCTIFRRRLESRYRPPASRSKSTRTLPRT